jgi:hypothetical protein
MSGPATLGLVLLCIAAACRPREIAVQVLVPDLSGQPAPVPGVEVAALPYDRDSLLALLESRAPTGRPHTRELDSLFQAFRGPFLAFARAAWDVERAGRTRDSLRRARAAASDPAALDRAIAALEDSLRRITPPLEQSRAALAAARDTLWPRIQTLQADVRSWELSTYAGYDTLVRSLARDRLKLGHSDTTDAAGWVSLRLSSGDWWLYARSPDPRDPNAHWYWNVPARGDTLLLDPTSGRHLARY